MKTKTVLIVAGLGVLGLALLAAKKAFNLKAIFDQMKIWPSNIKNFKASLTKLSFDLDFTIQNPTNEDFSVTGANIVRIKRVTAFRNGTYLGETNVDLAEITIPANSTIVLQNMPFEISVQSLLNNLSTIDDLTVTSLTTGLSIQAVVDVLGNEYVIES